MFFYVIRHCNATVLLVSYIRVNFNENLGRLVFLTFLNTWYSTIDWKTYMCVLKYLYTEYTSCTCMQFDRAYRMTCVGCASEILVSDDFLLFDATLANVLLTALQPSDGRTPKTPKSAFTDRPYSLLRTLDIIVACPT